MTFTSTWKLGIGGAALALAAVVSPLQSTSAQESPVRPASSIPNFDPARAAFEALPETDRKALQDALVWIGAYSGVPDGTFGRQTFEAIASFQQSQRKPTSGILSTTDQAALNGLGEGAKNAAGFTTVDNSRTGARIGVPTRLLPKQDTNANGGSRWQSADGKVTLDTRIAPPDATLQSLYDRNLQLQVPGRVVTYKVLRSDFFVIAGETPTGKFYTRYSAGPPGLRAFSIGYDKALAPQLDRVVVAIANSFDPFGRVATPAIVASPEAPVATPLAPLLESRRIIGTAIAVAPRRAITNAAINTCRDLQVGDIKVSTQPVKTGVISVVELPRDLPAVVQPVVGVAANADEAVFVVGFTTEDGRPTLTLVPGWMADGKMVIAPLQPGSSGAPVLNMANGLVGTVGLVSSDGRKIAGILTTGRYKIVPAAELAASLQIGTSTPAPANSAAGIAAFWQPALVPVTCAP